MKGENMHKGLTPIELIIVIFIALIILFDLWVFVNYGNRSVTEMPLWLYLLTK